MQISLRFPIMRNLLAFALLGVVLITPGTISSLIGDLIGGDHEQTPYCSANSHNATFPQCSGDVYTALAGARSVHGSIAHEDGLLPSWINLKLALKGQQFANKFFMPVMFGHLMGLVTTFLFPDSFSILMFTGASDNATDATMRYLATATQVIVWYQNFFTSSNPEDMLLSLVNVRNRHIGAARRATDAIAENQPLFNQTYWENIELETILSGPFFQDLLASNIPQNQRGNPTPPSSWTNVTAVPVNQQGFALTQFAFVAYPVYFADQLGIFASDDELWAFNHLWAVIGYAIGIDDQFNICLQPDLASARATYKKIWEGYFVPSLFLLKENKATIAFIDVMTKAFDQMVGGFVSADVMLHLLLSTIIEIPTPNCNAAMSPEDVLLTSTLSGYFEAFPVNQLLLPVVNTALNEAVYGIGLTKFGGNYTTMHTRAKYVYFPEEPPQ